MTVYEANGTVFTPLAGDALAAVARLLLCVPGLCQSYYPCGHIDEFF